MGMYLNRGNAGFASIRKSYYVDKTGMIAFINAILGTPQKLICVSRPRRFGKSFAAKMLCAYYDKTCDSRALFEDMKIAQDDSFEKYLNRYDVIYLDITWFISVCNKLSNVTAFLQEQVVEELAKVYPSVEGTVSLPLALAKISGETGNKFIVIIDEWDALFREAKDDLGLQKEYILLLRSLFKSSLTDAAIEAAYMTGILPIKKYGTQSAVTDFGEYSMVLPGGLAEYVGFTEREVRECCGKYGMDFESAKRWYDGYEIKGAGPVYNPNSVMEAMRRGSYGSYWTRTETYESLKIYVDMDTDGLQEAVAQMLGGARCPIDAGTFQNDLTCIGSRDDVLTLLVHLGYLSYEEETKSVFIPNEEIRQEFVRAVKAGTHREIAELVKASDILLRETLAMNGKRVAELLEKAHSASTAPLYYNNEQALRSVIRFAYISCVEQFQEIQELPSGTGYADVVYLPKKKSSMPILVVELKWNRGADSAIAQIKERNYPEVFEGYGSEILLVGVSYDEKTKKHDCVIQRHQREGTSEK